MGSLCRSESLSGRLALALSARLTNPNAMSVAEETQRPFCRVQLRLDHSIRFQVIQGHHDRCSIEDVQVDEILVYDIPTKLEPEGHSQNFLPEEFDLRRLRFRATLTGSGTLIT